MGHEKKYKLHFLLSLFIFVLTWVYEHKLVVIKKSKNLKVVYFVKNYYYYYYYYYENKQPSNVIN